MAPLLSVMLVTCFLSFFLSARVFINFILSKELTFYFTDFLHSFSLFYFIDFYSFLLFLLFVIVLACFCLLLKVETVPLVYLLLPFYI